MSYCRMGNSSDIYLLGDSIGLVCCSCKLEESRPDVRFNTSSEALIHLSKHIHAGHKVPLYALKKLKEEIDGAS